MRSDEELNRSQVESRARYLIATTSLTSWKEVCSALRSDPVIASNGRIDCSEALRKERLGHLKTLSPSLRKAWGARNGRA